MILCRSTNQLIHLVLPHLPYFHWKQSFTITAPLHTLSLHGQHTSQSRPHVLAPRSPHRPAPPPLYPKMDFSLLLRLHNRVIPRSKHPLTIIPVTLDGCTSLSGWQRCTTLLLLSDFSLAVNWPPSHSSRGLALDVRHLSHLLTPLYAVFSGHTKRLGALHTPRLRTSTAFIFI